MPNFSFDDVLDKVDKWTYGRYWKYVQAHELEDCIQEARIHAWEDYQTGKYELMEILRRASNRVRTLVQDGTMSVGNNAAARTKTSGAPLRSKDFSTNVNGDATREKIRQYIDEFSKLHNRKPTGAEIARGTGISDKNVYHHLKKLDQVLRGSDTIRYRTTGLAELKTNAGSKKYDGAGPDNGIKNPHSAYGDLDQQFEQRLVNRLVIKDYISRCHPKEQEALYYKFWEDRTNQGIADGLGGYTAQVGANWVKKGVDRIRILMEADADR